MRQYRWDNPMNEKGGTFYGKWWDYEIVELVRAHTQHTCGECGIRIDPGDFYYRDLFFKRRISKRVDWKKPPAEHIVCPFCWKGVNLLDQYKQDRLAELQAEQDRLEPLVAEALKQEANQKQ